MKGPKPRHNPKTRVVRVSEELYREVQKYAEPLVDDFEDALRKALKLPKREGPRG